MTNLSVILGRRRQGKSTLALSLAIARHRTVVFWDLNDQLHGFPYTTNSVQVVDQVLESGVEPVVIVLKGRRGELREQFSELVDVLFPWEDIAFVCDEASELQGANWIDEGLEHLVRRWNDHSTLVMATHRMRDTNPIVRQNATDFYFFSNTYKPDVDVIVQHFGEPGELITKVGLHECVHFWLAPGGVFRYSIWDEPEGWYLPLRLSDPM